METEKYVVVGDEPAGTISLRDVRRLQARPAHCTVPANLKERGKGMVSVTYLGCVSAHHEGGDCFQAKGGDCFVMEAGMVLEMLPGKLSDY